MMLQDTRERFRERLEDAQPDEEDQLVIKQALTLFFLTIEYSGSAVKHFARQSVEKTGSLLKSLGMLAVVGGIYALAIHGFRSYLGALAEGLTEYLIEEMDVEDIIAIAIVVGVITVVSYVFFRIGRRALQPVLMRKPSNDDEAQLTLKSYNGDNIDTDADEQPDDEQPDAPEQTTDDG